MFTNHKIKTPIAEYIKEVLKTFDKIADRKRLKKLWIQECKSDSIEKTENTY